MKRTAALIAALMIFCLFCSAAWGDASGTIRIENPTLLEWNGRYKALLLSVLQSGGPAETDSANGIISSREQNIRTAAGGERVLDGGLYSDHGIYVLGMGAGVDREDLWYVTLTFGPEADPELIRNNARCMIYAFEDLYRLFTESEDGPVLFDEILDALATGKESVGFVAGGKLLMRMELGSGRFILGVDSLAFYNAFYAGVLENIYRLTEE